MNWVIALTIFIVTYAILFTEKIDRTIITLAGALGIVLGGTYFGFYDQVEAFSAIDFDTISLVLGMMLMVGTVERTGVIDSVPLTIALIPVIHGLGNLHGVEMTSYWWALALGAVLGGVSSPIGSSANVISVSISEGTDSPIKFLRWLKVGVPLTAVNLSIASLFMFLGMKIGYM